MAGTLGHWDQKLISCVQWPLHPLQLLAAPRLRCFCFLKNTLTGEWEPGPAIGGSGGRTGGHGDLADGDHLNGENGSDKNWWPPRNVKLLILTYSWGH